MTKFCLKSIIASAICLLTSSAHATLVNINVDVPVSQIAITSFETDGFRFTADTGVFSIREYGGGGSQDYFYFGSTDYVLPPGVPLTQVSIERIDGGLFDLVALTEIADAAGIFGGLGIQTLTSDRGGLIDLYFDASNPDRQYLSGSVAMPELFQGISKLTFNELQPSFAAYDNFVFRTASVPEPATILLFIFGIGVIVSAGYWEKKAGNPLGNRIKLR